MMHRGMRRVYLGGPMTGIPQFNFPAFDEAAQELRREGYDIVSPAELDTPEVREALMKSPTGSWDDFPDRETYGKYLGRDVELLIDGGIDGMFVLPGWKNSYGTATETFVIAAVLGKPIIDYETDKEVSLGILSNVWQALLYTKQSQGRVKCQAIDPGLSA